MLKRPSPPSRPDKKPMAHWIDGAIYCPDCRADAALLAEEELGVFDEREIPAAGCAGDGCSRFHLAPMQPVPGVGDCRCCGCFGDDDNCFDGTWKPPTPASKRKRK